jgi:hypothetical protein
LSTVLPVTLAGKRGKSRSENTIKMNFEIPFLVFHVEPAIFLLVADDPDDYIYPIYGRMAKMDNDESDIVVGKFRLHYVDIASAINTGYIDMFDLFDSHSDSTADYYGSLFDPDTWISVKICSNCLTTRFLNKMY